MDKIDGKQTARDYYHNQLLKCKQLSAPDSYALVVLCTSRGYSQLWSALPEHESLYPG